MSIKRNSLAVGMATYVPGLRHLTGRKTAVRSLRDTATLFGYVIFQCCTEAPCQRCSRQQLSLDRVTRWHRTCCDALRHRALLGG